MLQVVTLALVLAQASAAGQDPLTIHGELKDVPAQGKNGPAFLCEGTTNLPDGVSLTTQLIYGKSADGKVLFTDSAIVKNGKFSQTFSVFDTRNFPGPYIARLVYDSVLQALNAPDYPRTVVVFPVKIGGTEDFDRESKIVRDQMIGDYREFMAIADEMKKKIDEMHDKPEAEREAVVKGWYDKAVEICKRADPRKHPEYFVLNLEAKAHAMIEQMPGILNSAGRCFVSNQRDVMLEGLTRLRQSCEFAIGEIETPRVQDVSKLAENVETCRALLKKVLENPDEPVLPARRRFLEQTALLDKSGPVEFHMLILQITDRATAFFTAASDKSPDVRQIQAELDGVLQNFAAILRKHE